MNVIEQMKEFHRSDLIKVQKELDSILHSPIQVIEDLGRHIFHAGGKRLRPILTLTCAKNFQNEVPHEVICIAAAVECIHTATLVHDDVLDESKLRRGVKTANAIWGNTCSILVGDFLFAKAFELMVRSNDLSVLTMLSSASSKICQGEVKQMLMTDDINALKEDYFDVVDQKTGALFSSACKAGAMLAGASKEDVLLIEEYGFHLGRAFQIVDDIFDYDQSCESIGKNPGDDYKEGKITLPVLELFQKMPQAKKIFEDEKKEQFAVIKNLMEEHHVFSDCYDHVHRILDTADACIKKLSVKKLENLFTDLTNSLRK